MIARRRRHYMVRIHIAMSRTMRQDLDFVLRQDGRPLGEFVRSLIAVEIKQARFKIVPPSAAH